MKNRISHLFSAWRSNSADSGRTRRNRGGRERRWNRLIFDVLEERRVLSTISWNATTASTGGDWNIGSNWVGGFIPGANDTAKIAGLSGIGTVYIQSGATDSVHAVTTDSTTTLEVASGTLSLGAASSDSFGGPVVVSPGGLINVGLGSTVSIGPGQTLADDGTVTLAAGDTVTFGVGCCYTAQSIAVNGTLVADNTNFNDNNGSGSSTIAMNSGGELKATNSRFNINQLSFSNSSILSGSDLSGDTFNLPINLPYGDIQYLANNVAFEQIQINAATLTSGTLNLDLIGVNTSGLTYDFPGGFTVAPGTTLAVGPNVTVYINPGQTFADNGTVTLAAGDTVTFEVGCCYTAQSITVNGTLVADNTNFNDNNGSGSSTISIFSGGELKSTNSRFNINQLSFSNSSIVSSSDLSGDTFNLLINLPYGDIQYLANNVAFQQIQINAATLTSGTLNLNLIGVNTSGLTYDFPGGFTVAPGTTLAVGPNVTVYINPGQTFADNGTVTLATGDTVTFEVGCCYTAQSITVNGTLVADNTNFNDNNGSGSSTISIFSGGELKATNSRFNINQLSFSNSSILSSSDLSGDTFNLPINLPYGDIQYLGNNVAFQQIQINAATLTSGTLNLNLIGVNTSGLTYDFPGGFTVAPGTTLAVGPNVTVYINPGQTFADNGTVTLATGDTVTFEVGCCYTAQSITVNGTLVADNTNFNDNNGSGSSTISIFSGGELKATNSRFNINQLSFSNSSILSSSDLSGDTFNLPINLPYGDIQYLGNNVAFQQIQINAATLTSGTLNLNLIGVNTSGLTYDFPGGFTVAPGTTLAVGPNVTVYVNPGQTLVDNGTVTLATGDTVTFEVGCCYTAQSITVNGTLVADNTNFNDNNGSGSSTISIFSGGELKATNSKFNINQLSFSNSSVLSSNDLTGDTFNLPINLPYGDIQYLGNNVAFQQIQINSATLTGGSLNLNLIGVNTSGLTYDFPGGFTVAPGTTLAVGPNVTIYINPGQTLTDNGTVTLATGDTITFEVGCCYTAQSVAVGGTLIANGTNFNDNNGSGSSTITINSGGHFAVSGGSISVNSVSLKSGSTDSLTGVAFSSQLLINSGALTGGQNNPSITGDDFSNVGANGVVASGDPNATIYLSGNYWGTTNPVQIAAKITDHNDNANLPTIAFSPFVVNGASGTVAAPVVTTFSPTDQVVTLSATVTTTAGVPINEGTETFTILNGSQVIGVTTAAAPVSNGNVSAQYTVPAGTPAAQYLIEANYSGTLNYLPSTDFLHFLTVKPATTNTTTANVSATFSGITDQILTLNAQVASTAGNVDEGIVTFTVLNGGNPVGASVIANVSGNAGSTSYKLLKGTAGGTYIIQAVYTDPVNFKTSTGTNTLTVIAAPTTVSVSAASASYNGISGEGTSLFANVNSTAGTINEGSVSFTVFSGSTKIAGPFVMSVSNGVASGNAFLPAGTATGTYVISAVYNGTASFASSLPATGNLTISPASTTTLASAASISFSSSAQSVPLTASVTSTAGTVSEGMVTFTILNGAAPVGSPVPANVNSGTASAATRSRAELPPDHTQSKPSTPIPGVSPALPI